MLNFFHRLRVSRKLMLISIIFMIPDSVLLTLFLLSINENIRFARWEQYGNEYQRPLEELIEAVPQHLWLSQKTALDKSHRAELIELETRIDGVFARLQEVDRRLGAKLQFTAEGLAKRKR